MEMMNAQAHAIRLVVGRLLVLVSALVTPILGSAQSRWQQLGLDDFNVAANSSIEILVSSHGRWLSRTVGEDWKLRGQLPGPAYRAILDEAGNGLITGKGFCVVTGDGFRTTRLIENGTTIYFQPIRISADTILATSATTLMRSINGGVDWNPIATPFPVLSLVFSDGQRGVIASLEGIMARTSDAGKSWGPIQIEPSNVVSHLSVFNGFLFAFVNGRQVLRSSDWGDTWDSIQLSQAFPPQIFASTVSEDGNLIAAGGSSVMRTTDNGQSWESVKTHDPYTTASSRSLATVGNKIIAAGTEAAVFESYDNGKYWAVTATANMVGVGDFAPLISGASLWKDSVLYLSSSAAQVRWSNNRGLTYSVRRLPVLFRSSWVVQRASENVVLIGGADALFLRSTDTGNTWNVVNMPNEGYRRIAQTESRLWMIGGQYIFVSDDLGATWVIKDSLGYLIADIIVLKDGRLATVGRSGETPTVQAHFSISDVTRTSWSSMLVPEAPGLLSLSQLTGDSIIACGRYGSIAVSTDMGSSWTVSNAATNDALTKIIFVNDSLIIAGTPHGVIESYDRGNSWVKPELPTLIRPRGDDGLMPIADLRATKDGKVYSVGADFILVRGLKPEEQGHAYVWTPKSNPWLRASVYPNPSTNTQVTAEVLGLHSVKGVKRQLGLYDILGRRVLDLSDQINRDLQALTLEIQIDTRDLAKGPYMLVLDAAGDRITEQLVVY